MLVTIDTDKKILTFQESKSKSDLPLYSKKAFEILSNLWLKVGWNEKYTYTFTWLGRPIIQLPEDMIRIQEVIHQVQPDVILETGIAHGGSLIFYASLCKMMGKGRVIGVDIEIRPHNREAIEKHPLFPLITLIEGNSVGDRTVKAVKSHVKLGESVLVILDSCHTKEHVLKELAAYSPFVSKGSYILVTDGIMEEIFDVPRGKSEWRDDNPIAATREFLRTHSEFKIESPSWRFNESELSESVTYWSSAWLKRIS